MAYINKITGEVFEYLGMIDGMVVLSEYVKNTNKHIKQNAFKKMYCEATPDTVNLNKLYQIKYDIYLNSKNSLHTLV